MLCISAVHNGSAALKGGRNYIAVAPNREMATHMRGELICGDTDPDISEDEEEADDHNQDWLLHCIS